MPRRKRKKSVEQGPTAPLVREGIREQYLFLPATVILAAYAYFTTMCPTVFVGDSGELATAAWHLGIPHSPGYPLFCLIGYFFAHLNTGAEAAYNLNLMSGFFGIMTVVVLYLIIYHFTRTPYISFSISLAYAFSPVFWSQCVVTEVYTLNTFLSALSLYFLCRWLEKRNNVLIYAAFYIMGLAATNHQISFLLLPTGLYLLYLFKKGVVFDFKFWAGLTLAYFAGLLIYAYLPIRALADPPLNWGNPSTFEKFMITVFAPAGSQTLSGSRWTHFAHMFKLWIYQFSTFFPYKGEDYPLPLTWLFGIWGIYKGLVTRWRMAKVFIFFLLINLFVILFVSRPSPQELMIVGVYYLPAFLVFAVFIATGLREWIRSVNNTFHGSLKFITLSLVIVILVLIPEYLWWWNRPEVDRSQDYYAKDHGTTILDACPQNSILIVNWDDIFTIWYLQDVENFRTDIIPVIADLPTNTTSSFWGGWYFDKLKEEHPELFENTRIGEDNFRDAEDVIATFVKHNLNARRDVCFSFYGLTYNFDSFRDDFNLIPKGPVYKASLRPYTLVDLVESKVAWERVLGDFRNVYTYHDNQFDEEDFVIARITFNLTWNALLALDLDDAYPDQNLTETAIWFLKEALKVDPANSEGTSVLTSILFEQERYDEVREYLEDARLIDPYNVNVLLDLTHLYLTIGDTGLMRDTIEQILIIDPANPEALHFKQQYL